VIILGIFPWCLTPDLYAAKREYVQSLADFGRSRPAQPVDPFLRQTTRCSHMSRSWAASGRRRRSPSAVGTRLTSTRFADRLRNGIKGSEVVIFEDCAHAAIDENVDDFNRRTLAFLQRHAA
jgi:pimeloyl-ACP methyl ester carboxylesterase